MREPQRQFETKQSGLTLIELMVSLTIAAIMMMFAIPAFNDFNTQRRISSNVNFVVSAINYARNEAARQGGPASVQAVDDSDNDNEWGPGFCVTLGDPGDCDAPLTTFTPEANITINGEGGLDTLDSWTFNSRGMLTGGIVGTVEVCGQDADQDPGRIVRISAIGRASVSDFDCF